MKKNIFGFICGLLGALGGALITFYTYVILAIILSFSTTLNSTIYTTLLIFNILSNIIALVGSFFYFRRANTGAILMTIALVFNVLLYVFIIIKNIANINLSLLIIFIPAILMLISAICGYNTKKH